MLKNNIIQKNFIIFLCYAVFGMLLFILLKLVNIDRVLPALLCIFLWLGHIFVNLIIAMARYLDRKNSEIKYYLLSALMIILLGPVTCTAFVIGWPQVS